MTRLRVTATVDLDEEAASSVITTLSAPVVLSSGPWMPTLSAAPGSTISIGFQLGAVTDLEVRKDWKWGHELGWSPLAGNCGIRFSAPQSSCTIRTLETAIAASEIVKVTSTHVDPMATVDAEQMEGLDLTGAF